LAALADAPLPEAEIDGHDIRKLLTEGDAAKSPWDDEGFFYYRVDQLQAVRAGPWKLYLPLGAKYVTNGRKPARFEMQLFDVRNDVGEEHEVSAANPEVVQSLMAMAERAREEIGDVGRRGSGQRDAGWVDEPRPVVP